VGSYVKYSFASAEELLAVWATEGLAIWQVVLENEKEKSGGQDVQQYAAKFGRLCRKCMERGLRTSPRPSCGKGARTGFTSRDGLGKRLGDG
jgi:L-serine deaminase